MRSICDQFAEHGYTAIAPAVFDRRQRNFESGYSPAEVEKARKFIPRIDWRAMLRDVNAAIQAVKSAGKVGIVGYCMGGTVAFLAAANLDGLAAAVGYYGGQTARNVDLVPKAPTLLHFGDRDQSIPMSDIEIIRTKRPECTSISIPRDTRSIMKSGRLTTQRARGSPWIARSPSSPSMSGERPRAGHALPLCSPGSKAVSPRDFPPAPSRSDIATTSIENRNNKWIPTVQLSRRSSTLSMFMNDFRTSIALIATMETISFCFNPPKSTLVNQSRRS